ncbi:hypothetical protein Tco_0597386 [Tanacetum coccineum]
MDGVCLRTWEIGKGNDTTNGIMRFFRDLYKGATFDASDTAALFVTFKLDTLDSTDVVKVVIDVAYIGDVASVFHVLAHTQE